MRRKHQKHSLKAKTSDAFETDVVRSDSVSGTISASGDEIRNTKYEICKAHKFQKIGRGTYQSGVGAFLKSRRRIYQWKSLNLNFLSPYDMTTEDIEEFKLFEPFIIFNESRQ